MKIKTLITLTAAVMWPGICIAALIFPPGYHLSEESSLPVMVYVKDREPQTITIRNEAGEEVKTGLAKGFNSIEINLNTGKNILQWGDDTRVIFLAATDSPPPDDFSNHYLHDAMDDCENCHAGGDEGLTLNSEEPELCYDCHDDQTSLEDGSKTSIHDPVAEGDCSSCHSSHYASRPGLLESGVPVLCQDCHDEVNVNEDGEALGYQHDPVESGDCLSCHQVHASDYPSLISYSMPDLCVECHDDPALNDEGEKKENIHEPLSDDDCTSCHQPHGSSEPTLLTLSVESLCEECHDYPFTSENGEKYKILHEPAESIECMSCHDPHASDYAGMILMEEASLCLECHDDPKEAPDGNQFPVVHEALEDGCSACHNPHGSDNDYLIAYPQADLCMECHEDVTVDEDDLSYDYIHSPVWDGDCGGCHNPHATAFQGLLLTNGNKLCQKCHEDYHLRHRDSGDEDKTTSVPADFPLEQPGSLLACRGCHLHHASYNESLFITDRVRLCTVCHKM